MCALTAQHHAQPCAQKRPQPFGLGVSPRRTAWASADLSAPPAPRSRTVSSLRHRRRLRDRRLTRTCVDLALQPPAHTRAVIVSIRWGKRHFDGRLLRQRVERRTLRRLHPHTHRRVAYLLPVGRQQHCLPLVIRLLARLVAVALGVLAAAIASCCALRPGCLVCLDLRLALLFADRLQWRTRLSGNRHNVHVRRWHRL